MLSFTNRQLLPGSLPSLQLHAREHQGHHPLTTAQRECSESMSLLSQVITAMPSSKSDAQGGGSPTRGDATQQIPVTAFPDSASSISATGGELQTASKADSTASLS